jgi:hypothetical protein
VKFSELQKSEEEPRHLWSTTHIMLRLVPKPPATEDLEDQVDPAEDGDPPDASQEVPRSGKRLKRGRPWWVDEFVAIEQRIRRALVRR